MAESNLLPPGVDPRQEFRTTLWSVVLAARDSSGQDTHDALETLCRTYWYPLYAYLRRTGHDPHDSQDFTQEFLARLVHRQFLRSVNPEEGKFRSFLLATLKHFLSDERKRARAQKRGGGQPPIPIDEVLAENRYIIEGTTPLAPDQLFDRRWALAALEQAVERLRLEYSNSRRSDLFEGLRQFQQGEAAEQSYAEAAARLGLTPSAMKSSIHRFRTRHRELLRQVVAETLTNPQDLEEELRYLLRVL